MRIFPVIILLICTISCFAQKTPADFGYREFKYNYKGTDVTVVVSSKKGEEDTKKPIMLYCQGSLPQPVLKYDHRGLYGVFPFGEDTFQDNYHVVIIGKPGVPVIADVKELDSNYSFYTDGTATNDYKVNNNLKYYLGRNNFIIEKLLKEPWAAKNGLVVVSHSEGTYVAAKMAATNKKVTKIILSSANPYGRILSILAQDRFTGNDETTIDYWKEIVADKNNAEINGKSDSYKTTYSFSEPIAEDLLNLKIPVLFCYGTKDWSAPYNDLLQTEAIRRGNRYITFLAYRGLGHNYFPVDEKMKADFNIYNWTKTGADWKAWLEKTK